MKTFQSMITYIVTTFAYYVSFWIILTPTTVQPLSSSSSSSSPNNPLFLSSTNYLNSLPSKPIPKEEVSSNNLDGISKDTPNDHYAKNNPGAGWAGYKNPMFGGYLDNLSSSNSDNDGGSDGSGENENKTNAIFEQGKKADYGDDVRWGAQVYLDNLKDNNNDDRKYDDSEIIGEWM